MPLVAGEEEPVLALQSIVQQVYERGRYHLAIDYTQPALPPLSKQDAIWVATLLQDDLDQQE